VQSLAAVFNDPIALLSPIQNSTLPVDLTWTGSGTSSQLQMATGSSTASLGAWTAVSLTPSSATSTRVKLAMGPSSGYAYQFRVRSCNGAVCSPWATGPKFTLQPVDEAGMAPGQFKGTWTNVAVNGAYGGSVRRASGSATATLAPAVTFSVAGNAAWVSTLGPDQGLAQVQVDNGRPEVVDLYSATVQTRRVVWARDALAAGSHTITLTVLGKKSPANPGACNTGAKCAQVDIDLTTLIK
jgi:outer membrane lipoprotein SlyB